MNVGKLSERTHSPDRYQSKLLLLLDFMGCMDSIGCMGLKAGRDIQEAAGRVDAVFGELDYLINGEGVAEDKRYPVLQEPEDLLKEMLKVNALGPYIVRTFQLACLQPSACLPHWL